MLLVFPYHQTEGGVHSISTLFTSLPAENMSLLSMSKTCVSFCTVIRWSSLPKEIVPTWDCSQDVGIISRDQRKCILLVLISFVYSRLNARGRNNNFGFEVYVGGTQFHYLLSPVVILNIQHSYPHTITADHFWFGLYKPGKHRLWEAAQSLRPVFVWTEIELGAEPG